MSLSNRAHVPGALLPRLRVENSAVKYLSVFPTTPHALLRTPYSALPTHYSLRRLRHLHFWQPPLPLSPTDYMGLDFFGCGWSEFLGK